MCNALDTCVCIGFTFYPDKHYPPANNFISTTQQKLYWTTKVRSEYTRKYSKINRSITYFSNTVIGILRKKDGRYFDSYYDFEKLILNNTRHINLDNHKKIRIIEYLWNKINNVIDFKVIKTILTNALGTFNKRQALLIGKLKYHHCDSKIHKQYWHIGQKFIGNGGHPNDDIVVVEAHHLGLTENLNLITFDEDMYEACSKINELSVKCILCQ